MPDQVKNWRLRCRALATKIKKSGQRVWPTRSAEVQDEARKKIRRSAYLWSILVNVGLWYLVNRAIDWRPPFITPGFSQVLTLFNLVVIANIGGYLLLIGYDSNWLWGLTRLSVNFLGLVFLVFLLVSFPFDFSVVTGWLWLTELLRLFLLSGIMIVAVASLMVILRLFFRSDRQRS